MTTGFWLCKDIDTALYDAKLINEDNCMVYLHGLCGIFALALNDLLGYDVEYATDETDGGNLDELIHVFCYHDNHFIDVRGKNDDFDKFWDEFEDFSSYPENFGLDVNIFKKQVEKEMGKEAFKRYYESAIDFINKNLEFYK